MDIVAKRLKVLRESLNISQTKIAELMGLKQSSINRYETGQSSPSFETMLWYADYFHVSMDYIFGRTDNPQGQLYDYQPEALKEKAEKNEELRQFIEMCFDPDSPMNDKLKNTLIQMLGEAKK